MSLLDKPRWGLRDVFFVFALRLMLTAFMGKVLLPAFGTADYLSLQIADSVFLIGFVAAFLHRRKVTLDRLFNRERYGLKVMLSWGTGVGLLLFILGNWGENWLRQQMLVDLGPHPLLQLGAQADRAGEFILPFMVGTLLVPLAEEVFYRGFLFPPLAALTGSAGGIILAGAIFALAHFDQVWIFEIVIVGMVLNLLYYLFRSLWPALAAHAVLNAGRLLMIYLI